MTGGLSFDVTWLPPASDVRAPELSVTWGVLAINVPDGSLIVAMDTETRTPRSSLVVPMYPVAEWIAFNWFQLFSNSRNLAPRGLDARSMRSIGDGFTWPDLAFCPSGDRVAVTIGEVMPAAFEYTWFRPLRPEWLPASQLRQTFAAFIAQVLERLSQHSITETPLHEEWARLQSLTSEEVDFCEVAARLGLDPFSEGVDLADSIDGIYEHVPPAVIDEFVSAANARELSASSAWIGEQLQAVRRVNIESADFNIAAVDEIVTATSGMSVPFKRGYLAAAHVRTLLRLSATDPVTSLPVATVPTGRPPQGLETFARRTGARGYVAAGALSHSTTARFQAARVLALGADGHELVLTTAGNTPSQRMSRAFAAELLAPAAGIREWLGFTPNLNDQTSFEACADHFDVSPYVIQYQVENQLLAA